MYKLARNRHHGLLQTHPKFTKQTIHNTISFILRRIHKLLNITSFDLRDGNMTDVTQREDAQQTILEPFELVEYREANEENAE